MNEDRRGGSGIGERRVRRRRRSGGREGEGDLTHSRRRDITRYVLISFNRVLRKIISFLFLESCEEKREKFRNSLWYTIPSIPY